MTGDGEEYEDTQISVRVRNPLLDEFEQWVAESEEYGNRSAALRGLMESAVGNAPVPDGGQERERFVPSDDLECEVYEACIEQADERLRLGTERLPFVAADTSVSTSNLPVFLQRLEGEYVRRYNGRAGVATPRVHWRIKPPEADPEQWTHGEQRAKESREARRSRVRGPNEAYSGGTEASR